MFIEKKGTDYELPSIDSDELKIRVVPQASLLLQNFPNPARDKCYIPFMLKEEADVIVIIYNILGQKVQTIEAGYKKAGLYIAKEKALACPLRNDRGDKLSQGLYFIRLTAGEYSGKGRLVIQR